MKRNNCSNQVQSNICLLIGQFFLLQHCMSFQSKFHRNENACKIWRKRVSFTYPVHFLFFHFPFRSFITIWTKLRTKKKICIVVSGDRHVAIVLNEFACTAEQQETPFKGDWNKLLHMLALLIFFHICVEKLNAFCLNTALVWRRTKWNGLKCWIRIQQNLALT